MEHVAGIDPVCEDLCAGILDELPSRALVQLRGTSRLFAELVNEILRRRFLSIVGRGANELVLESCPPYAVRTAQPEPLVFSHFARSADPSHTGDLAIFRSKAGLGPRVPHFMPLDDGEVFANNHLTIHLRQGGAGTPFNTGKDLPRIDLARPLEPRGLDFLNSIRLATSLDRFFRSWFVDPVPEPDWSTSWSPSAPSTPSSSPESTPWASRESSPSPFFPGGENQGKQPTRPRRLQTSWNQSSPSPLYGAQIDCVQVPASASDFDRPDLFVPSSNADVPASRFHSPPAWTSRVYEYHFHAVEMDVAKLIVQAEENMPILCPKAASRNAASKAPYIFVL